MRITTKTHYAVTALLDVALRESAGRVSLPEIAERHGISLSYLEQLFARLRQKGLVESARGRGGGYLLGKPAADIHIAAIVDALDEGIDTTRCRGKSNCQQGATCLSHHLWMDLSNHIHAFLASISLADLIVRKHDRDRALAMVESLAQLKPPAADNSRILARGGNPAP